MPGTPRMVLPHMSHHVVQRGHNRLEGRSGTLWEGRYKSRRVQTETYLLACTRYIELNPVRARMVPAAGDYAWSSVRQRMGEDEQWIDLDPAYLDLADEAAERRERYARFVEQGVPQQELTLMREALQRGQLTGNQRYADEVEQTIGCRIERRRPGRPPARRA
ncbi:putative transposase [Thioalkalivibrio sp. ALE21]|uniref:hypothetical protein n=1 Tax=Thioalkalivibrio sp. ALE21 TaxID=1158175 RepID=UPI000D97DDD4|nr:hypothetical protein [Thioalkalivibrio sp. ALE21]PYF99994.1 putative transposase [Thioalkalivibrio sp. ALE21]